MLPKAPKGLFDQATMTASAFYHYRGISNNNNADNQRGTSSKKFAFFLDPFTKRDALLFLGFHTQAIEKGAMLASLRKKKSHNNSKKIGSGLSDIEEGWEYHSAAIGRALASVFLDDEEYGDDFKRLRHKWGRDAEGDQPLEEVVLLALRRESRQLGQPCRREWHLAPLATLLTVM